MDFSYSQQQLEIKRGIREWGKKHLTEEAIAAGYKNRGIAPEIANATGIVYPTTRVMGAGINLSF